MSDSWNPQPPAPGDDEQSSRPRQPTWTAPSEGSGWSKNSDDDRTTENATWQGSRSGNDWAPNDFTPDHDSSGSGGKHDQLRKRAIGAVAVVALMIGSGATGAALVDNDSDTGTINNPAARTSNTLVNNSSDPATQPLAKVAAAVQPSVVSIEVSNRGQALDTGSGFIYRDDGTIVTNNHVISAAANNANATISVKFSTGNTAPAKIIGRDPSTDIAVIKVDNAGKLTAATLGTSASLHVGDSVLALGSPLGLDGSVASGIVSALHRTVNLGSENDNSPFGGQQRGPTSQVGDAIQTDAAINPGNSGGPLVDMSGAVVGINTAIASLGATSSQSGSIGVGFAIPVDEVRNVAEQLIRGETPKHALLGVQILDDQAGALIQSVGAGGAADKAGLKAGDIVTKFGDKTISTADELSGSVRTQKPNDKVTVTYLRGGQSSTTEVTLGSSTD